jgi:hypothetical protein
MGRMQEYQQKWQCDAVLRCCCWAALLSSPLLCSPLTLIMSSPASPALLFFDSRCSEYSETGESLLLQAYNVGEKQLSQAKSWHLNEAEESKETRSFHDWALHNEHVRIVTEIIPAQIISKIFPNNNSNEWTGVIYDYSPKGRADDEIYSNHREIWENITRGTAIIQLNQGGNVVISRWLVRANRKFTGHEDMESSDAGLYCVPSKHPAIAAIVTLKANGSVLHLSSRTITLPNNKSVQLIGLGSKKVHLAVFWDNDLSSFKQQISYYSAERHELVNEMGAALQNLLTRKLVDFLADNRLVINCEFVSPVSSGPINNKELYNLNQSTPYAFAITFNQLHTKQLHNNKNEELESGCDLCLHPAYSLALLKEFGFETVKYFVIPYSELDSMKLLVSKLPDIEGSVIYHYNEFGVIQLEKAKSGGYVVVRAFREKAKKFIFGNKKFTGLQTEIQEINQTIRNAKLHFKSNLSITRDTKKKQKKGKKGNKPPHSDGEEEKKLLENSEENKNYVEASHANVKTEGAADYWIVSMHRIDIIGTQLITMGGIKYPTALNDSWAFLSKPDLQHILSTYKYARLAATVPSLIRAQNSTAQRVREITHIPLSPEERKEWTELGAHFMKYLYDLILSETVNANEVFDDYAATWTRFYLEYKRKPNKVESLAIEEKKL